MATRDGSYAKQESVVQQLRARGGRLILIATEGDEQIAEVAGKDATIIWVPEVEDCLQAVVNIVPLQLLRTTSPCSGGTTWTSLGRLSLLIMAQECARLVSLATMRLAPSSAPS